MKNSIARASKTATARKRKRKRPALRATDVEAKITKSFASQVASFIRRYRPALEALAKR